MFSNLVPMCCHLRKGLARLRTCWHVWHIATPIPSMYRTRGCWSLGFASHPRDRTKRPGALEHARTWWQSLGTRSVVRSEFPEERSLLSFAMGMFDIKLGRTEALESLMPEGPGAEMPEMPSRLHANHMYRRRRCEVEYPRLSPTPSCLPHRQASNFLSIFELLGRRFEIRGRSHFR